MLIIKKCLLNWCNVKTDDYYGWVKTNNIWGFIK
jgi:SH3-like domain-containing protein